MRLPDWGNRRMFPTAPLREALAAKSRNLPDTEEPRSRGDDYYSWVASPRKHTAGLHSFCRVRGINARDLYKAALGEFIVDAICCKAGIHPSEVYEDWHSLADSVEAS